MTDRLYRLLLHLCPADFRDVEPVIARAFMPQEEQPGQDQVILLSYDFWQTRFGGDAGIIGRSLILDDNPYQVIGVLPPGFRSPDRINLQLTNLLLRPLNFDAKRATDRGEHFLNVIARLNPGVTLEQAQAKLAAIANSLEQQYPATNQGFGVRLVRLHDDLVQDSRQALLVLSGAVGFLLLISCANVANLLLVRASAQIREMAIRSSLGAGRSRLIRQLLTQSLLLGLLGGIVGVVLAYWGASALLTVAPRNIPRLQDTTMDVTVLGFSLLLSMAAGAFFGLAPAWAIARTDLNETLKESGRSSTGSSAGGRLRRGLIVVEIAVALVLTIGASLLIRTFQVIQGIEPGYRAENVMAMDISPPETKYRDRPARVAFFQQVIERVEGLPGVQSVGVVTDFPLGGSGGGSFAIEGRMPPKDPREWDAELRGTSPAYFKTMGIPLLEGRSLTAQDAGTSVPVAVINQAMARRLWPSESPIGKRIRRGPPDAPWDYDCRHHR